MKLKHLFLISLIGLSFCSEQLFQVLDKEIDRMNTETLKPTNFLQTGDKVQKEDTNVQVNKNPVANTPSTPTPGVNSNPNMSIFDLVNAGGNNQSKQNLPVPGIAGLNTPIRAVVTPNTVMMKKEVIPKESPIKVINDNKPVEQNVTEQINELKKEVQMLMQTNEKLIKASKLRVSPKHRGKDMISFLQKHDQDVANINQKLASSQEQVKAELGKKDQEFKKLYDQATKKVSQIQNKVDTVNKKLEHIKDENIDKYEGLKNNMEVTNINVKGDLTANIADIKHLKSDSIELPGIKISNGQIALKNSMVSVDGETVDLGELVNDYQLFHNFLKKCGNNFENCKPIPQQVLDEQEKTQKAILDNLMKLRQHTYETLNAKKKSFNR
jgi:uncharacterized protein YukE